MIFFCLLTLFCKCFFNFSFVGVCVCLLLSYVVCFFSFDVLLHTYKILCIIFCCSACCCVRFDVSTAMVNAICTEPWTPNGQKTGLTGVKEAHHAHCTQEISQSVLHRYAVCCVYCFVSNKPLHFAFALVSVRDSGELICNDDEQQQRRRRRSLRLCCENIVCSIPQFYFLLNY